MLTAGAVAGAEAGGAPGTPLGGGAFCAAAIVAAHVRANEPSTAIDRRDIRGTPKVATAGLRTIRAPADRPGETGIVAENRGPVDNATQTAAIAQATTNKSPATAGR